MQYAISDRIGVFSLALPPWVIAIASAGSVASDGSGEVDDMEGRPAPQDSRIWESAAVTNILRV